MIVNRADPRPLTSAPEQTSSAGKTRGSSVTAAASSAAGTTMDNWLMKAAQSDANSGSRLARLYTFNLDMPLMDITELARPGGVARYSATGEPVTEERTRELTAIATKLQSGRIEIYEAEKAKGTPDAEILAKVVAYMDQNAPADYLKLIAWERISGRTTA